MKTYKAGDEVSPGFYLNRRKWDVTTISEKPGPLSGTDADVFVRVPGLLVLLMAPIMGAVFAIFLPFIGIALLLSVGAKNVMQRFSTPPPAPVPPREEPKAVDTKAVTERVFKKAA